MSNCAVWVLLVMVAIWVVASIACGGRWLLMFDSSCKFVVVALIVLFTLVLLAMSVCWEFVVCVVG